MNITFANNKLEKIVNDDRKLLKEYGQIMTKKIKQRLMELANSETLQVVKIMPCNYHELTGNRKGQWACDLVQPYRLIFEPHEKPIPTDASGRYLWFEIKGVEIIEIVDYH